MATLNDLNQNMKQEEQGISITEIIQFVKKYWKWYAVSIGVCLAAAVLYIKTTPEMFLRKATILIKDNSKGGMPVSESSLFQDFGMFSLRNSVDNEFLVFQSQRLMEDVVRRLQLDISYQVRDGIKWKELYTQSPFVVQLLDVGEQTQGGLTVTPISASEVVLSNFSENGGEAMTVALKDTVETPLGKVSVMPTLYYGDSFYHTKVTVSKRPVNDIAVAYLQKMNVSLASKQSTIIYLCLVDESTARAEDVINTLIAIYNEAAINDKNQIARNTSEFINDRLIIIEKELGSVDTDIERFKKTNQLTDIHSETGTPSLSVPDTVFHP
jgi:tyrosine-protein kinase Etk/Wzc